MVTKALLGDPVPQLAPYTQPPIPSAVESVRKTAQSLAPYWDCLKFNAKLPHDMINHKKQMILKMADLFQSTDIEEQNIHEYKPGQFGAYSDTFGINTLSDIKTVSAKMELILSNSKNSEEKKELIEEELCEALLHCKTEPEVEVEKPEVKAEVKPDPNIYIPGKES